MPQKLKTEVKCTCKGLHCKSKFTINQKEEDGFELSIISTCGSDRTIYASKNQVNDLRLELNKMFSTKLK